MGLYDTVEGVQIKSAPNPQLREWRLNDAVPLSDGLHVGREGAFIVMNGKVAAVARTAWTKWGDAMTFNEMLRPYDPYDPARLLPHLLSEYSSRRISFRSPPDRPT